MDEAPLSKTHGNTPTKFREYVYFCIFRTQNGRVARKMINSRRWYHFVYSLTLNSRGTKHRP